MTIVAWARRAATAAGLALVAWATPRAADAQFYFGQNQVQYDRLDWRVIETEHFLVHYYPVEHEAAVDAARMAERSYARLSRLLQHQFREKKPIIVYASRGDFAQSNVFGDLGEGTGGVTDILRQRMAQPLTGDYRSFEHVLMHEMVHQFQYDIFSRGKAGAGLQNFAQVNPPYWFMEGMAEFLSLGYDHPQTDTWIRDAAINGRLPSIEQMTTRPDEYFPYRFGFALWQYVGQRWGDEVIGEIMNAVPNVGIERAFKRELGLSLDELGEEWKEAMQLKHLPRLANLDRARKFSQPLLTQKKTGGFVDSYTAPALSPDGKHIAFISYGNLLRGEITPSIFLADAETGKRLKRLVESGFNTNAEELRQLYSQSSFSPDGRFLAFTGMRKGKDVLFLLDVQKRKTIRRFDLPLEGVTSPTWSPDGRRLAFSGTIGGISDLFVVDADGRNFRRLTHDRFGDNQPSWSPDGKTIAFASDRDSDFETLRLTHWKVALLDLASGRVTTVPGQDGMNINPQWSPDGQSIAFVSDRTGIPNLFLFELGAKEHYQLTNVVGAVNGQTEYSPAITWARSEDLLAYTYFDKGVNNVWAIKNPRLLKKQPFRAPAPMPVVAAAGDTTTRPRSGLPGASSLVDQAIAANLAAANVDTTPENRSLYRPPSSPSFRQSAALPALGRESEAMSVTALLDSAELALPDTARFRDTRYKAGFQPEYVAQPQIGYQQNNFGAGLFGGTAIVLGDLLSNHQLTFAGAVNGQVSDAILFGSYTNLSRRLQYTTGLSQQPIYVPTASSPEYFEDGSVVVTDTYQRWVERQAFATTLYPLSRFRRIEVGARLSTIALSEVNVQTVYDQNGFAVNQNVGPRRGLGTSNLIAPYFAYVSDNALFGYTSPILGRRLRLQVEPTMGSWRYIDWLADVRRYDPILFNFITLATRFNANITAGRDEALHYKWIGRPDLVRGYNRDRYESYCGGLGVNGPVNEVADIENCSVLQLVGSRVMFANVELRFPLIRRFDLGVLPIALPPVDAVLFYDAGIAWYGGQQSLSWSRPENYNLNTQRFALRSYGFGVRFNLFGFAILRWDYAKPLDQPGKKAFGTWFIGPSF